MKRKIAAIVEAFVEAYARRESVATEWGRPLIGFADAAHPYILRFKEKIAPSHALPTDVLPGASIVIAYFVPFTRALADTNRTAGDTASPEWARAYEETNKMFEELNTHLIENLRNMGYRAAVSKEAATFDASVLKSNWSQRHFARAAGLGTFGIHNMLITKAGCCGRCGTVVTNLDVAADPFIEAEYCHYKRNGSCGVCADHCPSGALTVKGYDRQKCYSVLRKNAALYTDLGCSYLDAAGQPLGAGSEVCGKCVVNAPCAFREITR